MGKERARGSLQGAEHTPRSSAPFRGLTNVAGFPRLTPWAYSYSVASIRRSGQGSVNRASGAGDGGAGQGGGV
jgi:hypothetical protein